MKLTPQSQYGIMTPKKGCCSPYFEVDSTESVWYNNLTDTENVLHNFEVDSTESVWYRAPASCRSRRTILKLTPQSKYGIMWSLIPWKSPSF